MRRNVSWNQKSRAKTAALVVAIAAVAASGCAAVRGTPLGSLLGGAGPIHTVDAGDQPVGFLELSLDGKYLAVSLDAGVESDSGQMRVFRLGGLYPQEVVSVALAVDAMPAASFGEDGSTVQISLGDALAGFSLDDGAPGRSVVLSGLRALSEDGRYALRHMDFEQAYEVFDLAAGEPCRSMLPIRQSGGPSDDQFVLSPDGALLAHLRHAGHAAMLTVWDTTDGRPLQTTMLEAARRSPMHRFSGDGEYLAIACIDEVRVLRSRAETLVGRFPAGDGGVAISSDGRFLACGGVNGPDETRSRAVIDVYRVESGERIARIECGTPSTSLAFSDDDRLVLSGHASGTVRFWKWRRGEEATDSHSRAFGLPW